MTWRGRPRSRLMPALAAAILTLTACAVLAALGVALSPFVH